MSYDTKVLLIAIAEIVNKSRCLEEVYTSLRKMANAEGVILDPFEAEEDKR